MPRRLAKPVAKTKAVAKPAKKAVSSAKKPVKKAAAKAIRKTIKKAGKAVAKAAVKAVAKKGTVKKAPPPVAKPAPAPKPVAAKPALKLAPPVAAPKALKFTPPPASKIAPSAAAARIAAPVAPSPAAEKPAVHLPRPGESKGDWFARVAHDYYRFLYATALPITRNNDDAEDAVQNAVMSGLKRLDQLTEPGAIVSWLAMITRNAALDVLRRKKRAPGGGGDVTVLPVAAPEGKNEYAVADDMRMVLANAITTLPLSYQEVVNARHFDGLEVEDIAKRLGMTENNIRVRLFRAYEKLRESAQVRRAMGLPEEVPSDA